MARVLSIPNVPRRRQSHSQIPDQGDNYVLNGLDLSYDGSDLHVSSGQITILSGDTVYWGQVEGKTLDAPADTSVYYNIDTSGSAPSGELSTTAGAISLKVGSVDVSAGTTSTANRRPNKKFGSVETDLLGNARHFIHADYTESEINAVISEANEGDIIKWDRATFQVSSPIEHSKTLLHEFPSGYAGNSGSSDNFDDKLTEKFGTVIEQQTAGEDVFRFTGVSKPIYIKGVPILTWATTPRNSDTGHGFHAVPPNDPDNSTYKQLGMGASIIDGVVVDGHDGDHYAMRIVNPQHCRIWSMQSWGGGGMEWVNNTQDSAQHEGNSIVARPYARIDNAGAAHGYHFHAINEKLNFIDFYSPQCNIFSSTPNDSQRHIEYTEEAGGDVGDIGFIFSDMESGASNAHGINIPPNSIYWPQYETDQNWPSNYTARTTWEPEFSAIIRDDFGDDSLGTFWGSTRQGQKEGVFFTDNYGMWDAFRRPEWRNVIDGDGTVVVSGGAVQLSADDELIYRPLPPLNEWIIDFRTPTVPSGGSAFLNLFDDVGGDTIDVEIVSSGGLNLRDGGTDIISSTWPQDTESHRLRLTRDYADNFEMFLDGASKGTASAGVSGSNDMRIRLDNYGLDQDLHIEYVEMR
jgi:hypothetical protein